MTCILGKISTGINENICTTNPSGMGYEAVGFLFNWDDIDWDNVVIGANNNCVITDLALLATKKGYTLYQPGDKPFDGTKFTSKISKFGGEKFDKTLQYVIFNDSPEVAEEINNGLSGRYVALLKKTERGLQKDDTYSVELCGNVTFNTTAWWTEYASALTSISDGGGLVGRVTADAGSDWAHINTTSILEQGKTYRVSGRGRGDGTNNGLISNSGITRLALTASTTWQSFAFDFIAGTSATIELQISKENAVGTEYVDWDDISIKEIYSNIGNQSFELIGTEKGLKMTNIELDANSEDTDGGYLMTLLEASAKKPNVFFFNEAFAKTLNKVEDFADSLSAEMCGNVTFDTDAWWADSFGGVFTAGGVGHLAAAVSDYYPYIESDDILTTGHNYVVSGRIRGDGTTGGKIISGSDLFVSTISTGWQYFRVEFTASYGGVMIAINKETCAGTEWIEFDDISIKEIL